MNYKSYMAKLKPVSNNVHDDHAQQKLVTPHVLNVSCHVKGHHVKYGTSNKNITYSQQNDISAKR